MEAKNNWHAPALELHARHTRGKTGTRITKPLLTPADLSLAYSPGVAAPCLEIEKSPDAIFEYTNRGNMVAVISNGTAVLGLGNIGAAASKPVMEGKSALLMRFADVDSIDLEVDTEDPEKFINAVRYLGTSFGGINLEDIKAPECFIIERELKRLMSIPVFHDDQHGTAIVTTAGLINALDITNRKPETARIVINGAGAAAIACTQLLKIFGIRNITLCDTRGVIHSGRTEGMNEWKVIHASETDARTLEEVMLGADIFIGLSKEGALSAKMVAGMAPNPIIFAMANPVPEIMPEEVESVRKDAIVATGRSDYANQINNVMAFPYIFRGALDVLATDINDEMKIAAAKTIAALARQQGVPNEMKKLYEDCTFEYGPKYIVPVPFDTRLLPEVSAAVAIAAIESGIARRTIDDIKAYKERLVLMKAASLEWMKKTTSL